MSVKSLWAMELTLLLRHAKEKETQTKANLVRTTVTVTARIHTAT